MRANVIRMRGGWQKRLFEAIENDGRDMKAISLAAGCGQNYVQQMIRDGKRPRIDNFVRILKTLGRASSLYIILGTDLTQQDEELYNLVAGLSDDQQRAAIEFLRTLQSSSRKRLR